MREILADVERWADEDRPVAIATVVQTWGSAPRGVGSKMAVALDPIASVLPPLISGSVSGGCVEGDTIEAGLQVLDTGTPQLLHYGVADEAAWEVGLACGGTIDIFVEPLTPAQLHFWRHVAAQARPAVVATVIQGEADILGKKLMMAESSRGAGAAFGDDLDSGVFGLVNFLLPRMKEALRTGASGRHSFPRNPDQAPLEIFIEAILPLPQLVCIGGGHIAIALTQIARLVGFHTIVIDPRSAFVSEARFAHADQLLLNWPQDVLDEGLLTRNTAVAVLTHDPKIDDKALTAALNSDVFYIGALGSKKTHAQRLARLQKNGFTEAHISRIHAPIGLDIHAQTPEEIAVAVMAEIVAARRINRPVSVASKQHQQPATNP